MQRSQANKKQNKTSTIRDSWSSTASENAKLTKETSRAKTTSLKRSKMSALLSQLSQKISETKAEITEKRSNWAVTINSKAANQETTPKAINFLPLSTSFSRKRQRWIRVRRIDPSYRSSAAWSASSAVDKKRSRRIPSRELVSAFRKSSQITTIIISKMNSSSSLDSPRQ